MSELTKEFFKQTLKEVIAPLATKDALLPLATKQDVHREVREGVEELARIVATGFKQTTQDHLGLKQEMGVIKESVQRLELGQENLKLRVDSLAPRFEMVEIDRRVKRLEDRAGIKSRSLKFSA